MGAEARLTIVTGAPPPPGWTGKLWALEQGTRAAAASQINPDLLLLTDADIAHSPDSVRRLVARAEANGLVLTSLMAKLHCATPAERALIPAFVFFFDMLYPFAAVNDPAASTAAAAGGCMLVRRAAFEKAGGVSSIRSALIDDCALGARMKAQGPIWLGLSERVRSLRPYASAGEVARMIARSAYAQLRYSPWLLAGALAGLAITYAAPPALALLAHGWPERLGLGAWIAMSVSFQPMLRFYGRSPLWGPALPLVAGFYAACTLLSAVDVWRGRGGIWKGRVQALAHRT
jgi:hopene-associated glycosyltransferase HpnB